MTTPVKPSYRKRVGYQGGLLGGFATLAAALLVIGNAATYDAIELRNAEDLQASLGQVIPDDTHDNNLLDDTVVVEYQGKEVVLYRALNGSKVTAVAYTVSQPGYSGEIFLIMGVNRNGEILGVRTISHTETPGLGDKIEAEKDDWVFSFDGLSFDKLPANRWAVKKDGGEFDQFSGATITPRAVVTAVKDGLGLFHDNKASLLEDQPEDQSVQDETKDTVSVES
jgi:electron transport complex protein RnfG